MSDYMQYLPHMEQTNSDIMERLLEIRENYDYNKFNAFDVENALAKDSCDIYDLMALLSPVAGNYLEGMARKAMAKKRAYFGDNIYIFTPLYIANYCDNHCVYCGFNSHNKIERLKLDENGLRAEMEAIAKEGIKEVLILTGESETHSSIEYIGNACKMAKEYFDLVGLEIYPVNSKDYAYLHECGVDFVTIFQETYNPTKYSKIHLEGNKRIFPYRFYGQFRAIKGGMRGVGFGALLGLDDWRKDALSVCLHANFVQKLYPHAEIALSVPRLRPIINHSHINPRDVHEKELLQVIMAYRIFLPYASITISTRENARFRDNAIKIGATKISASVSVGIGEHSDKNAKKGDEQFEISDSRSFDEVISAIDKMGLNAVLKEYIYV